MTRNVYLVLEPIQIIATDLAMNVQDHDPSATVLIAASPEAACQVLAGEVSVCLAFVHVDFRGFEETDLARALHRRGAAVVFTGGAAERSDVGRLVLERPFSSQSTAALLQHVEQLNKKCA